MGTISSKTRKILTKKPNKGSLDDINAMLLRDDPNSNPDETLVLMPKDPDWLNKRKNDVAHKIIYEHALWPSKKQVAMSIIAAGLSIGLVYFVGWSFLHYALLGRHKVPGIQALNALLSPGSTVGVNDILNFFYLNLVIYTALVQYPNEYLLKKSSGIETNIWRDIGKLIVSVGYAVLASIPYGALALASGGLFAVILQLILFSAMQVVGASSLLSAVTTLLASAYRYFRPGNHDNVESNVEWDKKIEKLSDNPALLLGSTGLSINNEENEESKKRNLREKIEKIKLDEKAKTGAKGYYATLVILMALFGIASYGYFALTKGAGVNAIFGENGVGDVTRWILGVFSFLPFVGLGIYSQSDTAQTISTLVGSGLNRVFGKGDSSQSSQPARWSNWLYVTRTPLAAIVIAGYFFAYLSGAAAIALNEQAGLTNEFIRLLTCFGAMLFNGYALSSIAQKLDWISTILITYERKEWYTAFNTSLAGSFFKGVNRKDWKEEAESLPIYQNNLAEPSFHSL